MTLTCSALAHMVTYLTDHHPIHASLPTLPDNGRGFPPLLLHYPSPLLSTPSPHPASSQPPPHPSQRPHTPSIHTLHPLPSDLRLLSGPKKLSFPPIMAIRQKPAFRRKLMKPVPLYQRSHFPRDCRRDNTCWPPDPFGIPSATVHFRVLASHFPPPP